MSETVPYPSPLCLCLWTTQRPYCSGEAPFVDTGQSDLRLWLNVKVSVCGGREEAFFPARKKINVKDQKTVIGKKDRTNFYFLLTFMEHHQSFVSQAASVSSLLAAEPHIFQCVESDWLHNSFLLLLLLITIIFCTGSNLHREEPDG